MLIAVPETDLFISSHACARATLLWQWCNQWMRQIVAGSKNTLTCSSYQHHDVGKKKLLDLGQKVFGQIGSCFDSDQTEINLRW
jgi:hypothetical protein